MIWFIIYVIGSFLAFWILARRIGRNHNPEIEDEPEYALAYFVAFLGSWISMFLMIYYDRQNNRENNKNSKG